MLKRLLCQCSFDLRLEALEPHLIKSGEAVVSGPDMAFVRTRRGDGVEPFLPGSSLKGVLRSHAERIARTLKPKSVCGVFDQDVNVKGCSWRFNSAQDTTDYARSCPACRLFGSLHWKGRFATSDAYLTEEHRGTQPELRDGIGIDRVSGGVAGGAKFDLEVMPAGVTYTTRIELVNFELWQLGWMAYVVRDLMEGHLRIGSGTARGLGRMKAHIDRITLSYVGSPEAASSHVVGIGSLVSDEERAAYGLDDQRASLPDKVELERPAGHLRTQAAIEGLTEKLTLLALIAPTFDSYITSAPAIKA
jgi:CRISPR-associated RAMP protein (TIGR02581 family)